MARRIIAIFLIVLAVGIGITAPILAFTPVGASLFAAPTPTPQPVLTAQGTPPPTNAKAAYLLDADTGHTLVNIQGQEQLPMASITKITTAIMTIETANLNQVVTVQQDAVDEAKQHNGSNASLVVGDKLRLKDLLYGLMLPSGDDASIAIADAVAGTKDNFVRKMNDYAHKLHLTHTHYINPDGLTYTQPDGKPDPNHYTTAADLAQLTRHALTNPFFAQIVQLQHYVLPATNDHHKYTWDTTDTLLSIYPGATGVKTGYTEEAGYCLVFSAVSGDHHLIGVLLHEDDEGQRFADAKTLLEWGFNLPLLPPKA